MNVYVWLCVVDLVLAGCVVDVDGLFGVELM